MAATPSTKTPAVAGPVARVSSTSPHAGPAHSRHAAGRLKKGRHGKLKPKAPGCTPAQPAKRPPAKHKRAKGQSHPHPHRHAKKLRHKHAPPKPPACRAPHPAGAPAPAPPVSRPAPAIGVTAAVAAMQRLLWRAAFGPAPGQAEALANGTVQQAVLALTRPSGQASLVGPAPRDSDGQPLAPADRWGHDHCYWLDRMVRSDQPLVERMALIWHDWFATSNEKVDSQQRMLDQTDTFRALGLGSFRDLFLAVTRDPAMLTWLDGTSNSQWDPNENYAREMMELFSLGADRSAYTENDVREMARALTGWRSDWSAELGHHNFRFDPSYHDASAKTIFGRTGAFDWTDAVGLCVSHPLHASFFVTKLWGYFIPTAPDPATSASLQNTYVSSGFNIRAVVEAILQHGDLYRGEEMVAQPVVYNAALLRARGRAIDTTDWVWLSNAAGQQLYYPPNVSGWDFNRWLDTTTLRARWQIANYVALPTAVDPWPTDPSAAYDPAEDAATAMARAWQYWGSPRLSSETRQSISAFAAGVLPAQMKDWEQSPYRAIRQNSLRMLIAASPDLQAT